MNKKDYKKIAEIIKNNRSDLEGQLFTKMILPSFISELICYFEETDRKKRLPRDSDFDRKQFLIDCGVQK